MFWFEVVSHRGLVVSRLIARNCSEALSLGQRLWGRQMVIGVHAV